MGEEALKLIARDAQACRSIDSKFRRDFQLGVIFRSA